MFQRLQRLLQPLTARLPRDAAHDAVSMQIEEALASSPVVAVQWRGQTCTLLLGDLTVVEWHIRTEDPHGVLSDLYIDRTGAAHLSGPVLCAAMDLNSGLALAAEAAADAHGHAAGSELVLLDGLKARSKRGWGTRDVTRVPLPHRAKAVHINCSADLVAVHCGQRVMLFRVQRPEGGGHPKRNPCKLLLLSQHHLNGASLVDCRFSRSRPNVLLACEVRWEPAAAAGELWALRLDCDAAEGSGLFANPLREAKLEGVEGRDVTAVGWDATENTLVVGTRSGTAMTHRINAATCAAGPGATAKLFNAPVTTLQWHPSGGVLLAGSHDGLLRVCTLALHPLPVAGASAGDAEGAIMNLGAVADSATARPTHVQWEIPAPHRAFDAATPLTCGCVLATEGSRSVALLSMDAGLADRSGLSAHAITAHLLADNERRMAVQAAAAAGDARDRYLALSWAFHSLTRLEDDTTDDAVIHELMEAIMAEATATNAEPNVVARYGDLCRLYCQRLLAVERTEAAWAFADALGDSACLEDVYVHAVRHGAARLAACAQASLLATNVQAPPHERPLSIQQLAQFRTMECTCLESLAVAASA